MKKYLLLTVLMIALAAVGGGVAQAGTKVKVCHIPPGNPENFHTITISDKALAAHLAHGDLAGSCFANAEALCDDGNACTIDAMDPESETCLVEHPAVDCDDSNLCTSDTCDPANGCQSAPIVCDDGDLCTVDMCNPADGQCSGTPIDCGALGVCLPATGQCDFPCDGITCDPISQCHEAGTCVLPGECVDGDPVADGTACDDGDAVTSGDVCTAGVCAGVTPPTPKQVDILGVTLDPFLVSSVSLVVETPWLSDFNPDGLALDMEITGLNGGPAFHGEQVTALADATVVFGDALFTEVAVTWTADTEANVAGEVFSVCITVVRLPLPGTPEGPETCADFGPF